MRFLKVSYEEISILLVSKIGNILEFSKKADIIYHHGKTFQYVLGLAWVFS